MAHNKCNCGITNSVEYLNLEQNCKVSYLKDGCVNGAL